MPTAMREARVASLYKKGDSNLQDNYKPISLLNLMSKIIATIIKFRLEACLEGELMATQFGFRAGRSTTHAIHIAWMIQKSAERGGIKGAMIFLDLEKVSIRSHMAC